MIVRNTTGKTISINQSVQTDVYTPDENDGLILAGQTIDLSKSLNNRELIEHQQLREALNQGDLVLVVGGLELLQSDSLEVYNTGESAIAKTFDPVISKTNLYQGLASGFIYAKNCLIG